MKINNILQLSTKKEKRMEGRERRKGERGRIEHISGMSIIIRNITCHKCSGAFDVLI